MSDDPLANRAANGAGRDLVSGRFTKGWKGGPGNPHSAQVGRLRAQFLAELRDEASRNGSGFSTSSKAGSG
jgi:hypothetical protein